MGGFFFSFSFPCRAIDRFHSLHRVAAPEVLATAAVKAEKQAVSSAGEQERRRLRRARERHRRFVERYQDPENDDGLEIGLYQDWSSDEEDEGGQSPEAQSAGI